MGPIADLDSLKSYFRYVLKVAVPRLDYGRGFTTQPGHLYKFPERQLCSIFRTFIENNESCS